MKKRGQSSPRKGKRRNVSGNPRGRVRPSVNQKSAAKMEKRRSANKKPKTRERLPRSNDRLIALNERLENRNAELRQISNELRNVLDAVDIPVLILDGARRVHRFTPPAKELLGLRTGDIGRSIRRLRMYVEIQNLEELIEAVISRAEEITREVQSKKGRWYSLRVRPFQIGEDSLEGVLMTFVDIHELKQHEAHLLKERNFISAILDAAKDLLVVVLDREGRIVQFNRVCQQLTGYSIEEVRGRRPWDFLLPPDEVPAVKETFNKVLGGESGQFENHWIAKDGRRLLIAWSNMMAANDGEVDSVIATGADRTERAEARLKAEASESTIRALLETAAQSIVATDRRGRIRFVNGTTEKMFGYGHEELVGQSVEKLMPERFRSRHSEHLTQWFSQPRNRQMAAGLALFGLRKDGTEFPVDVGLSYIQTASEVLAVSFISDVSEQKRNEKALLDYHKRLQDLTASLISVQETDNKELARELHDVFSQELAALAIEVSSLVASRETMVALKEQLAELGGKIRRLADRMHGTSRRLHPRILHELGLETALREECDKFSEHTGISVQFTCEELPASLSEDVALCLYRVAQESLLNIRKHAGATDAQVDLRGETGGVRLIVADAGDGFDVDDARKRGGLGLTSMEERIRMVNGKFTIQSRPGTGARVDAFVPLDGAAA
jgi:PAS domain S-box-containing protein